jgi:hypothetical protein
MWIALFQRLDHRQIHLQNLIRIAFKLLRCCYIHLVLVFHRPAHAVRHCHLAFHCNYSFLIAVEPADAQHGALTAQLLVRPVVEEVVLLVQMGLVFLQQRNELIVRRRVRKPQLDFYLRSIRSRCSGVWARYSVALDRLLYLAHLRRERCAGVPQLCNNRCDGKPCKTVWRHCHPERHNKRCTAARQH